MPRALSERRGGGSLKSLFRIHVPDRSVAPSAEASLPIVAELSLEVSPLQPVMPNSDAPIVTANAVESTMVRL
jgi:hypothetical protein